MAAVAMLLAVGCTSGDDTSGDEGSGGGTGGGGSTTTAPFDPAEAARAPGVTDDAVKIGITYVDLEAISDVVVTDHGDYEATYRALVDDLNERGGINGRTIEPVIAPVNPIGTEAGEAACLKLTEDDEVFAVIGFVQGESVLCYVETHETAVIGGDMTPERLERAKAPWFSAEPSSDLQADVVREFAEAGALEGTLGVVAMSTDEALLRDSIEPLLDEEGIDPAEVAIIDAPQGDVAATEANAAVVAQRFESSGIDTVLVVGSGAGVWSDAVEKTDYRPTNRYAGFNETLSWINDAAGNDLSVLEGALSGGPFGPKPDQWELPKMQDCLGVLESAGLDEPKPRAGQVPRGEPQPFVSAATACANVSLLEALLSEAGKDLNYATLRQAGDGLEVTLPPWPDPLTFGPPPAADGDPAVYLYEWDPASKTLARKDD
jgi:hypothetical protein